MNIGEKSEACPPAEFHDERIIHALQLQRHSPRCAEGVSAHTLEIVALCNKVGLEGSEMYESGDVACNNVLPGADEAQRGGIGTALGNDAMDATGQGFDWTKPARTGSVVYGGTALPVLLVVHPESDRVSRQ